MNGTHLPVARWEELTDSIQVAAQVDGLDVVVVRRGTDVAVFEGRCPHRGALLADGRVEGDNLVCGVHSWDFRLDTGVSAYNPAERIHRFNARRDGAHVVIDKAELVSYQAANPSPAADSTYGHVTLIATGGLRRPQDMAKALALGADALALSNAPL
jgi:nitrite reductase/ring-hydroxylating ferredoxin subunit